MYLLQPGTGTHQTPYAKKVSLAGPGRPWAIIGYNNQPSPWARAILSAQVPGPGFGNTIPGEREPRVARDIPGGDALTMLNTRRPVNIVFTARDKKKESMPIGVNEGGRFSALNWSTKGSEGFRPVKP